MFLMSLIYLYRCLTNGSINIQSFVMNGIEVVLAEREGAREMEGDYYK